MIGVQLEWHWCAAGGAAEGDALRRTPSSTPRRADAAPVIPKPLVVLLPWVWAEGQHINKYIQLCHQNGCGVLVARWPMLSMWFPVWSSALASSLITAVGTELLTTGLRPVVFWSFSGAAKGVYASLLAQLAAARQSKPQQAACASAVLRCAVGQVFDSGPVDFSSDVGRKLLSPNSNTGRPRGPNSTDNSSSSSTAAALAAAARSAADVALAAGVKVAAGGLDFLLMEWFDRDRDNMWSSLRNTPVGGPVLMLYSRCDELADAAQIASLAASLRRRGRNVLEQVWHDSPHVGHLRAHPQAYSEAVTFLLSQALQEWSARSSRRWEGRDWSLRWQQQQQSHGQQQQETGSSGGSPPAAVGGAAAVSSGVAGVGVGLVCAVTSNYRAVAPQQQQQHLAQEAVTLGGFSSSSTHHQHPAAVDHHRHFSHQQHQQQQQQQEPQLVMQATKGRIRAPAKNHQFGGSSSGANGSSSSGSSARHATPTLMRAGTSGSTGSSSSNSGHVLPPSAAATSAAVEYAARRAEVLAQQLTPWVLASQLVADGGGGAGGSHRSNPVQHGVASNSHMSSSSSRQALSGSSSTSTSTAAVVRISGWPATATAVAAAMSGGGTEPVCSDSTLLSHSLRCLASSFIATHMSNGSGVVVMPPGIGPQQQAQLSQAQQLSADGGSSSKRTAEASGAQQQQPHQQQQQPFMVRMVNRLRSKL